MKVYILRSGTIRPPVNRMLPGSRVTLPVWYYLIEHPAQGLLLVDTGLGTQPLSPFLTRYYKPEPEGTVTAQLQALGFTPEAVDAVILSDLDFDHTGSLHELRGAKRFLVSQEDYYWTARNTFSRYQPRSLWENDIRFETYYLRPASWAPFHYALDLFGDESVVSVLTRGHTFGNCTTMLQWNGKKLLLAGNTLRSGKTMENDRVYHHSGQEKSVRWLRETAADPSCLGILATHDPAEQEHTIEL